MIQIEKRFGYKRVNNNNGLDYFNFNVVVRCARGFNGSTPWHMCFFPTRNGERYERERGERAQGEFKLRPKELREIVYHLIEPI